jgi:hypothetical protein
MIATVRTRFRRFDSRKVIVQDSVVPELEGSLDVLGLPHVVDLIATLGKTGYLRMSNGRWSGTLAFEAGRIVGARFGEERGLAAVDAMLLMLGRGDFFFDRSLSPRERGLEMSAASLRQHVAAFARTLTQQAVAVSSPDAVPRRAPGWPESPPVRDAGAHQGGTLVFERSLLETLLAVDGRRSVAAIAGEHGLAATVSQLAQLAEMGLVSFDRTGDQTEDGDPPETPRVGAGGAPVSNGAARPLLAAPAVAAPGAFPEATPSPRPAEALPAIPAPPHVAPPPAAGSLVASWWRTAVLAVLATGLIGVALVQQTRTSDRPAPATVLLATPAPDALPAAVRPATDGTAPAATAAPPAGPVADPAVQGALRRLSAGLAQRDGATVAAMLSPAGLEVAPYGGALPDAGFVAEDSQVLVVGLVGGADVQIRGWRPAGSEGIIVLTDGWDPVPLHLANNVTMQMTSLAAFGLVPGPDGWTVRWLMTDPVGALATQARTTPWLPWPLGG